MGRRQKQIHPYLTPDLHDRWRKYLAKVDATESAKAAEAIQKLLDDAFDAPRVQRRLNRLQREITRIRRENSYIAETLSVFVLDWFAHTPPIPDNLRAAAGKAANLRMD